jgi:1,4-alpha-glucan branching enzyme
MKPKRNKTNIADRSIEFRLEGLSAREVSIVGDFNQWEPEVHRMRQDKGGVWTQTVTLSPGRYEYRIYADGQWFNDPKNPLRCANCYGSENNVLVVRADSGEFK